MWPGWPRTSFPKLACQSSEAMRGRWRHSMLKHALCHEKEPTEDLLSCVLWLNVVTTEVNLARIPLGESLITQGKID